MFSTSFWHMRSTVNFNVRAETKTLLQWLLIFVVLTVMSISKASIMPSIMYKLSVNPPAHKGPKMVARPPTERLTPWLNPVGGISPKKNFHLHTFKYGFKSSVCVIFFCASVVLTCWAVPRQNEPTLCFLSSDFGEERHLRHGHEGKPQQLQKHSDDEGWQLPSITTWQRWKDDINYNSLPTDYTECTANIYCNLTLALPYAGGFLLFFLLLVCSDNDSNSVTDHTSDVQPPSSIGF